MKKSQFFSEPANRVLMSAYVPFNFLPCMSIVSLLSADSNKENVPLSHIFTVPAP